MGHSETDSQLNLGAIPKDAADAIDELFHRICAMLRKHGREIIPKKMLYAAGLYHWLNIFGDLGSGEVTDESINEFVGNIEKFWKEHGGELKKNV